VRKGKTSRAGKSCPFFINLWLKSQGLKALALTFVFVWGLELELGAGAAPRFAEAPAGNLALLRATKGFPQREAEGLRPRLIPWKDLCLVVSRSVALSPRPCRGYEVSDPFVFLQKERRVN
jgi:hypothetical protein